jgi:hypothetical protein
MIGLIDLTAVNACDGKNSGMRQLFNLTLDCTAPGTSQFDDLCEMKLSRGIGKKKRKNSQLNLRKQRARQPQ